MNQELDDAPPLAAHRWLLGLAVLLAVSVVWTSRAEVGERVRPRGSEAPPAFDGLAQVMGSLVHAALVAGALFAVSRVAGAAARLADRSVLYLGYARWALAIVSTAFLVTTVWVVLTTAGSGHSMSAFHAAATSLGPGAITLLAGTGIVLLRRLPPLGGGVLTACASASLTLTALF